MSVVFLFRHSHSRIGAKAELTSAPLSSPSSPLRSMLRSDWDWTSKVAHDMLMTGIGFQRLLPQPRHLTGLHLFFFVMAWIPSSVELTPAGDFPFLPHETPGLGWGSCELGWPCPL